jgi:hypothetical protein
LAIHSRSRGNEKPKDQGANPHHPSQATGRATSTTHTLTHTHTHTHTHRPPHPHPHPHPQPQSYLSLGNEKRKAQCSPCPRHHGTAQRGGCRIFLKLCFGRGRLCRIFSQTFRNRCAIFAQSLRNLLLQEDCAKIAQRLRQRENRFLLLTFCLR